MFTESFTEILLSNGNSYVISGNYEKVIKDFFTDSGQLVKFYKIDNSFINVAYIVEIKDYRED
ncbi:hypothetical protein D1B33_08695 [Lysinibacillus yapensis]|uniref:Uncharacterized protein n=1 Tax=Ureibacillus yapensis TaxID=2304605 RepID=A0A396S9M8_9BACL|nr:hypothetical protein [Lysinibacillus yapensis]RHW37594.1 hypothetical protein D1B33_08695 [Lysinibacillus yapensis]